MLSQKVYMILGSVDSNRIDYHWSISTAHMFKCQIFRTCLRNAK